MGKDKATDLARRRAAKVCRAKIAYATEHEAQRAANEQRGEFGKLMGVYGCGFGGRHHWHTTSS